MSSVSGYTPGGYVAKMAQAAAEQAARRKQEQDALNKAQAAIDEESKKEEAEQAEKDKPKLDENGHEIVAESDPTKTEDPDVKAANDLAEYKKGFQKTVRSMTLTRHFIMTNIHLNIDDAGYEKMMNDPAYEQKVMGMLKEKLGVGLTEAPKSVTLTVNAKGEKAEAEGGGTASTGLGGVTGSSFRAGGDLDSLTDKVMSVMYYRLGSDPFTAAKSLLNREA